MIAVRARFWGPWLLALALGCGRSADPPTMPVEPEPLSIDGQAGSTLVDDAPRPTFDRRHLPRISVAHDIDAVWRPADGAAIPMAIIDPGGDGGVELRPLIEPPPGPGALEVERAGGRTTLAAAWSDPDLSSHPLFDDSAAAYAHEAMGASRQGRDVEAIGGMIEASGRHLRAGQLSSAINCLGAAAHYARRASRLDDAAQIEAWNIALIDAVDDAGGRLASLYRQALLAKQLGRFRVAEAHLLAAADGMRRIGRTHHAQIIEQARGNLLGRLGRHREALDIHGALPLPEGDPEALFRARINRAWARLQAMRAGALPADYPLVYRLFEEEARRLPSSLSQASAANVYTNMALAALLAGQPADARRALAAARARDPEGGGLWPAFLDLLAGELALAEGDPAAARAAFREAARRARAATGGGDSIEEWQALYGEGRAAMAQQRADDALACWRAALAMTRRLAGRTSLTSSHSAFLADRRALVDDLVRLLLDRGEIDEAFRALDAARAPTLRALAAESRLDGLDPQALGEWRRRVSRWEAARRAVTRAEAEVELAPAGEQAQAQTRVEAARRQAQARFDDAFAWLDTHAPLDSGDPGDPTRLMAPDTALVSIVRIGEQWHGFRVTESRLEHRPALDAADPLGPWAPELLKWRRIYIIDGGLPAARTLAERPIDPADPDGPVWGERVELAWLPFAGWLRDRAAELPDGRPLVVADPDGTLPGSRAAAVAIAERAGLSPLVGEAATRSAVLARLDGARWFHFDGHGVIGRGEPWQAHLRMARDEVLTLADVLASRPRVGTVVLSGCETGVPEALSRSESLGLAEGFLLAGASRVIAADRVLGVEEAARFVDAFHRHGGAEQPAAAMRATIAELRRAGDDAWRGWRVFGVPVER